MVLLTSTLRRLSSVVRPAHPFLKAVTPGLALTIAGFGISGGTATSVVPAPRVAPTALVAAHDPLAGGPWGVYTGPADGVQPAYQASSGSRRALLARVALRPRVRWFTSHIGPGEIRSKVADYVAQTQAGNPNVLVQLAVFRLWPHHEAAKNRPLSGAEQAAYRSWIDNLAAGLGSARAAVVLEPDLPVALSGWRPSVRLALTRYAAERLSALPHTSVYIDGGDADWLSVSQAASMLQAAGVQYARGFALGATHYSPVTDNIEHGSQVVSALAALGIPGRHFVIDTADNGRGFSWPYWHSHQGSLGSDWNNIRTCSSAAEAYCDTLGLPPTPQANAPALHLSAGEARLALAHVDGYLWFGRPWLVDQASPFSLTRTLAVAATTPYQ